MARKAKVTRTILTTTIRALVADVSENKMEERVFTIPGVYKSDKELNKYVAACVDTGDCKVLKILDTKVNETLYGMDEQKFIANAEILPPRPVKSEN